MIFKPYFLFLLVISSFLNAQQNYFERTIKELTSDEYNGRGYTYDGMLKASLFLREEFQKIGLESFGESYFQEVEFPINVIEDATLVINGQSLLGAPYSPRP